MNLKVAVSVSSKKNDWAKKSLIAKGKLAQRPTQPLRFIERKEVY